MCLYPRLVKNPKYLKNKKNKGRPPLIPDCRVRYVPIGCGKCIECRKQKANEWRIRLGEQLKVSPGLFVTFTLDTESVDVLTSKVGNDDPNKIARCAVRLFLERFRKKYGRSAKHWLITELGHTSTERIHLHGIIFENISTEILQNLWQYGFIFVGDFCNEKSVNYMVKYMLKIDSDHPSFEGKIFCSPGLGANFVNQYTKAFYNRATNREYYKSKSGYKLGLPVYYRNKFYTEDERESLWLERLDKNERFVLGQRVRNFDTCESYNEYLSLLRDAQRLNRLSGFGDCSDKWKKGTYHAQLVELQEFN